MADSLIKPVKQTAQVKDLVKKRDRKQNPKANVDRKPAHKKDSKRIIDTYA